MNKGKPLSEVGQSLFEVLVAMVVITIVIVAVVALAATSIKNMQFSKNNELATHYSQEAMEWLRSERDAGWDAFAVRAAEPSWCIKTQMPTWPASSGACLGEGDRIVGTIFTREVEFTVIDAANVNATVGVSWTDGHGLHEVRTVTTFSDWRAQ